jgi:hypothetical protein
MPCATYIQKLYTRHTQMCYVFSHTINIVSDATTILVYRTANLCTKSMLLMVFLPQVSGRLLLPGPAQFGNRNVSLNGQSSVFFPEVSRVRTCAKHRIATCPVCNGDDYLRRRVCKAVGSALKRLKIKKTMPIIDYLGADSWSEVLNYLGSKRRVWNVLHPEVPMTLTNTALDHIRPVSSFKECSVGAQKMLCNHYTNLQPLLHEDNSWKGDCWSLEDETHWHANVIMKPLYECVYYPKTAPSQPSLLRSRHTPLCLCAACSTPHWLGT